MNLNGGFDMPDNRNEKHLDVYENRYELHDESGITILPQTP